MAGAGGLWAADDPPSNGDRLLIASGAVGVRQIECLPTDVPPRGQHRPNWKRERYCAVAFIRHLFKTQQSLFPIVVERIDSPDFVLTSCRPDSLKIAVEVTDAGEWDHQRWLDGISSPPEDAGESEHRDSPGVTPACPRVHHVPGPIRGWNDDAPRRHFSAALGEAVERKLALKVWRRAADLPHWLVLYDSTNAGWVVTNSEAEKCLRDQIRARRDGGLSALALVRHRDLVWVVECN